MPQIIAAVHTLPHDGRQCPTSSPFSLEAWAAGREAAEALEALLYEDPKRSNPSAPSKPRTLPSSTTLIDSIAIDPFPSLPSVLLNQKLQVLYSVGGRTGVTNACALDLSLALGAVLWGPTFVA